LSFSKKLSYPRKIKRILNILMVTDALINANDQLRALQRDLITRLIVLQVQNGELYSEISRQPDLLLALEGLYGTPPKYRLDRPEGFAEFGARSELIYTICKQYFSNEGYLPTLFRDTSFAKVESTLLPLYLSMGGA
jgi:hypothetical protein